MTTWSCLSVTKCDGMERWSHCLSQKVSLDGFWSCPDESTEGRHRSRWVALYNFDKMNLQTSLKQLKPFLFWLFMQQPMRFFMFIMWENSPSFSRLAITSIHPLIFCCAEAGAVEGMNPPTQTPRLNTIAFLLRIQQYPLRLLQAAVSGRWLTCLGLHHLWRKTSKTELCGSHAGLKVYSLKATNTLVMPRNAFQSSDARFPASGWASSFARPSFTSSCFLVELPSVQADMFLTLLMVAVCHLGSNHHLSFLLHGGSDEVLTRNGCRHHYWHCPWARTLWQHKQYKRANHKNERLCIFEKLRNNREHTLWRCPMWAGWKEFE